MRTYKDSIVFQAGQYVAELLIKELSVDLLFHNFHHTTNVVRGIRDIASHLKLSDSQKEILQLAGWFHDSGLIVNYKGHELESQKLARRFLEQFDYPEDKMEQVLSCIAVTEMPQQPKNLLEMVICDADLFHLSLPEYCHLQILLLEEWRRVLSKECTDLEWAIENMTFLEQHCYWTDYGKGVLQKAKELNMEKCRVLMG